jgi:N-acetylmuramic acid 6-phosphate etherase
VEAGVRPGDPIPATEREHPGGHALDTLAAADIVRLMADEEQRPARALHAAADAVGEVAEAAARALAAGGSLVFCGAGTSGRLGVCEASECPPTFRARPEQVRGLIAGGASAMVRAVEGAEDDREAGAGAVRDDGLGAGDLLVGISASGGAPFVRAALFEARGRGALTALLCCNPAVAQEDPPPADMVVPLPVGPEVLAGSTRLKAGTVTKMALNAITTTAFSLLGKVHGNLMVDVMATNAKLRGRARRLVERIAGASPQRARALLEEAGWRVKEAIVMASRGVDPKEAARLLSEAGGRLRPVIESKAGG